MAVSVILGFFLSACSDPDAARSGLEVYESYDRPASRPSDPSAVRVKVSTSRQRVYVMEHDRPLLVMPVSVGAPSTPTPEGQFRILHKDRDRRAPDHGIAHSGEETKRVARRNKPAGWSFTGTPLPYWVEFKRGIGFHTGWIKHIPCTTDGCIRMHQNLAPKFYELVRVGTPVSIAATQKEDRIYGSIPLPPDAGPLPDHDDAFYLSEAPFSRHTPPAFE